MCSYVGSNYSGLQQDAKANALAMKPAGTLPTVEDVLADALYQSGTILESNKADLAKLKWSRSSRTDKGVHAAKVVLSGKLEIDADSNLSICPLDY